MNSPPCAAIINTPAQNTPTHPKTGGSCILLPTATCLWAAVCLLSIHFPCSFPLLPLPLLSAFVSYILSPSLWGKSVSLVLRPWYWGVLCPCPSSRRASRIDHPPLLNMAKVKKQNNNNNKTATKNSWRLNIYLQT